MSKLMAEQLDQLGFLVQQTAVLNLPRLILNPFQVLHLIVDHLPLTLQELAFITAAKGLSKSIVLSLLNANKSESQLLRTHLMKWVHPDALTVSQTNHLKIFRHEVSAKMILPELTEYKVYKKTSSEAIRGFLFPLINSLDEATHLNSAKPVYFDGRKLLKLHSSSQLRKIWGQNLKDHKIKSNYHLLLSDEKIDELLKAEPLALILASPQMLHSEFTRWLTLSLSHGHLLVLNQFQATGFSTHWTSGHNCLVLTSHRWIQELNSQMDKPIFQHSFPVLGINQTSIDTLFNDLSRLYVKIVHQKTSLIESDSAKI